MPDQQTHGGQSPRIYGQLKDQLAKLEKKVSYQGFASLGIGFLAALIGSGGVAAYLGQKASVNDIVAKYDALRESHERLRNAADEQERNLERRLQEELNQLSASLSKPLSDPFTVSVGDRVAQVRITAPEVSELRNSDGRRVTEFFVFSDDSRFVGKHAWVLDGNPSLSTDDFVEMLASRQDAAEALTNSRQYAVEWDSGSQDSTIL